MPEFDPSQLGCPCDRLSFPPKPEIPAGLSSLPRQLAGFPEYRLAMLGQIRAHDPPFDDIVAHPLADWRAREGDDLGVMLLEMWAYVLDVLAFYDERIANEAYLRTAQRPTSLLRLVGLIGYHPRPALAAKVTLALIAEEGSGPVALPAGVAFRSGPFGDEPPQVFETVMPATIDPRRNEWTLAPIRGPGVGNVLYMNPGDAAIDRGDLALFQWGSGLSQMAVARVAEVSPIDALDGQTYLRLVVDPAPQFPANLPVEDVSVFKPTLSSRIRGLQADKESSSGSHSKTKKTVSITRVRLDSVQDDLVGGDLVIFVREQQVVAAKVSDADRTQINLPGQIQLSQEFASKKLAEAGISIELLPSGRPTDFSPAQITVTSLDVAPALPDDWTGSPSNVRIHFAMVEAGRLTKPAKHRIERSDLQPTAALTGVSEPLEQASQPKELLLLGDDGVGARLAGTVKVNDTGAGSVEPGPDAQEFPNSLRTPVRLFGNLVAATRGESVVNEVLGTGNATLAFQRFSLAKELTYLNDPAAPNGRRSTLAVRVNGLLWREVPSFFGIGPDEEAYIVRRNPETGESIVTFGDGQTGARLSTGVTVVANYRSGAGAASPPANSITQLARPVLGLRAAENPVPAAGGADGDQPKDLRRHAPDSALLLGRAVSLEDFEALAREFGVVNALADWAWDRTTQRAVVKIWFIGDHDERELKNTLLGQADPNTPLVTRRAAPLPAELIVDLIVDPRFNSDEVELAVAETLTSSEFGVLALENIPIGGPLFRSAILQQILSVEGADSVRALTFDGQPFGATRTVDEGNYFNFLAQLRVGNTAAGDQLFAESVSKHTSNTAAS